MPDLKTSLEKAIERANSTSEAQFRAAREKRNSNLSAHGRQAQQERGFCTYPNCKCIVRTSTAQPEPICPHGFAAYDAKGGAQ